MPIRSDTAKTCRPRWDAADRIISSESALFIPVYLDYLQGTKFPI